MDNPSDEYTEKTSPMMFSPIKKVSPIIPYIGSPMDEMTPPMGYLLDDPSDEVRVEKTPPMGYLLEGPSDENVREAVSSLLELTVCVCDPEDHGGAHHHSCWAMYRADVVVLVAAAGIRYA